MIDADRALRAYTDVLAVEHDPDAGMMRVVTLSEVYYVDTREARHQCPDREYHDPPEGLCKHLVAAQVTRDRRDAPTGWLVSDDLDERTDPEFDIDPQARVGRNRTLDAFATDGGRERDTPVTDEIRIVGATDAGPKVERVTVVETGSSTRANYTRLSPECAALIPGESRSVADLPPVARAWVEAETDGDLPDASDDPVRIRDRSTGEVVSGETVAEAEREAVKMWRGER